MLKNLLIILISLFIFHPHLSFGEDDRDLDELEQSMENYSLEMNKLSIVDAESGEFKFSSLFSSEKMEEVRKDLVDKFVKNPVYKGFTKDQIESTILNMTKDMPIGKQLKENPKLLNFTSDVMTDDKALPKLFEILTKTKEMKTYATIAFILFIIGFIAGLFVGRKNKFFKRLIKKFLLFITLTGLNIGVFLYFFGENLKPTFEILKKYL